MQFIELGKVFMPSEQRTGNFDESCIVVCYFRLLYNSRISLHYINVLEFKRLSFIFVCILTSRPILQPSSLWNEEV